MKIKSGLGGPFEGYSCCLAQLGRPDRRFEFLEKIVEGVVTNHQPRYPRPPREGRRLLTYGCLLPFINATSALLLGLLVVYSDADDYPTLTGILSAANVGGWVWWLVGSLKSVRAALARWSPSPSGVPHPGFRLIGMLSIGGAISWIAVLCLLAYGMLA